MTAKNSQCSIDSQILLNKILDDQKSSADRNVQHISSHECVEQHGHTMTRNNSQDSIDTMILLNTGGEIKKLQKKDISRVDRIK